MEFVKQQQKAFHGFVNDLMKLETTPENAKYQSVVSMVYTLIEENRLDELHETLQAAFPEYWHPEESKGETVKG